MKIMFKIHHSLNFTTLNFTYALGTMYIYCSSRCKHDTTLECSCPSPPSPQSATACWELGTNHGRVSAPQKPANATNEVVKYSSPSPPPPRHSLSAGATFEAPSARLKLWALANPTHTLFSLLIHTYKQV